MYSRFIQPLNKWSIHVTNEVSKPDKSREVREEQPLNISSISTTLEVSKLLKFIEVKDIQL